MRHARTVVFVLAAVVVLASCSVTTGELENVSLADGSEAARSLAASPSEDPSFGTEGVGDRYYPTYGNGGYDVDLYNLELIWDHDERTIDGRASITLNATQQLSRFNLDLVGFDVTAVSVGGVAAEFERDGRELIITPATALDDEQLVDVVVEYSGIPTAVAGFDDGWMDFGDTVVVAGEPEGASGWYPVNEHPIDKALYRIQVTARADLVVAANGVQAEVTDNGATKTWVYESVHPQASYLTTLAIGNFVPHEGAPSQSGVPVRHFFHEDVFDESVATMERTGQMIDVLEAQFGPYPFDTYGSVVVDEYLGFALETQTLSVFGSDLVDLDATREDVVVHEVAHQWFGNHVSLGQWSDIWLNEGFATYSQFLWLEAVEPGYDIDAAIQESYDSLGSQLATPPGDPTAGDLFNPSIYYRAAYTLHALRTTVGDDAFFQTLATYVSEYGGGNAETQDFIELAEGVSGQDLQAFFDQWLFANEIPPLPR